MYAGELVVDPTGKYGERSEVGILDFGANLAIYEVQEYRV